MGVKQEVDVDVINPGRFKKTKMNLKFMFLILISVLSNQLIGQDSSLKDTSKEY